MNLKSLLLDKRLYAVIAIAYFSIILFPGSYVPIDVGLDPSWRYAVNYLPHSSAVFGRDVAFTYGPIGYFLVPLNIGSNLVQATLFHALIHGLLILILLDYALRRKKVWPTIFLVVSFVLAPLVGEGLREQYEYSFIALSAVLAAVSYQNARLSLAADIINPLLAGMFLFMKFSMGVSSILMIATLVIVRILRRQKNALRAALIVCSTLMVTTIGLAIPYCGSLRNFSAWVVESWQMADGYSMAMSLSGGPHVVAWALVALAGYLALLIILRAYKSPVFYVALVFSISIFLCFKHSFVRQDAQHVLYFFPFLLSLVGILGLNSRDARELRFTVYCYLVIFILALPNAREYDHLDYSTVSDQLSGNQGLRNLSALLNLGDMRKRLDDQGRANLEADRLPAEWTSLIGENNGKVGTLPWEVTYSLANNLRWDPFPALQTYNAHKATLDQWCADHYEGSRAPEFLLINFRDIDERNPLLSTPATWRMLLRNYVLLKSDPVKGVQLFKKKPEPVPSTLTIIGNETARLDEWVSVPPSEKALYAFLEMRLRPLGWTSKSFYQIPAVIVTLMYASGSYAAYRMIPDTARNGLLMNYLPTDGESLDRLFANAATDRVVRFRISGPGVSFYNNAFELTWKEAATTTIVFVPGEQVSIKALPLLAEPALSAIEYINKRQISADSAVFVGADEDAVTIFGWAVDPKSRKEAGAVFVNIDGMDIPATYRRRRADVAQAQNNTDYTSSGFYVSFPTSVIGKGKHILFLKIVTTAKDGYYQSAPSTLEVR